MKDVLERLAKGEISVEQAERLLRVLAVEEVGGIARLDIGREVRKGIPEVILGEGKDPEDVKKIAERMVEQKGRAIISRVGRELAEVVTKAFGGRDSLQLVSRAKIMVIRKRDLGAEKTGAKVGILTAGTSDIPVAEEARTIAEEMGCEVLTAYDVGVAGIHRLFPPLKKMIEDDVDVIVVVAGREGALPTVVAGIVDVPVIAVPTSSGHGWGGRGVSALMAMLQACSLGIGVVNIDGGVAAGAVAALIANRVAKKALARGGT